MLAITTLYYIEDNINVLCLSLTDFYMTSVPSRLVVDPPLLPVTQ